YAEAAARFRADWMRSYFRKDLQRDPDATELDELQRWLHLEGTSTNAFIAALTWLDLVDELHDQMTFVVDLPSDEVATFLPTSEDAVLVSGEFAASDNVLVVGGQHLEPEQVLGWLMDNTDWEPGRPVVLVAGLAGSYSPA